MIEKVLINIGATQALIAYGLLIGNILVWTKVGLNYKSSI